MGRPRKDTLIVRFSMPRDAYKRFEKLGETMGMDGPMAIRVLASLQLAQLEATHVKPDVAETPAEREGRATKNLAELLPEVAHAITEPEADPTPEPMGFQRSRSELDELVVIGAPLAVPDAPMWTGYMQGL